MVLQAHTETSQDAASFKAGMKLEAKDRKNPSLTCVATITEVKEGKLLIHFDGWTTKYDYWCQPDTTDIHPIGWCAKTGKSLQPPKGKYMYSIRVFPLYGLYNDIQKIFYSETCL